MLNPIVMACVSLHHLINLFKNQNEPTPIIPNAKVEKTITNVLNPEVSDFLCIPTSTEVDSAPAKMKPKIANRHIIASKSAISTLRQINIIPSISMANKNRLNSSSIGVVFCKELYRE